ncbi:MAG TPA: hypothetical protein VL171_03065 [Verrucomicrobiae bacterium]|nr:hypothetical protein [Verrucomicrobiae bacterium]
MFEVRTDPTRNLLLMTFREDVGPAELAQGRAQVTAALEALQPGFWLLTDLSGLDSMDYACAPEIEATMDLMRKKGITEVVRVVPDPHKDIGFNVMSHFHYDRKTRVLTVDSLAEALEKLSD